MVDGKRRSRVNFHSFRRWFITKAERSGSPGSLIAASCSIAARARRSDTIRGAGDDRSARSGREGEAAASGRIAGHPAPALLEGLSPYRVLADKAYDSNGLRNLIASMGAEAVIPCNPTRRHPIPYDFEAYKVRNTIERCFNKLKNLRRIATRFDRRAAHVLAFLQLAAAMIRMR